MEFQFTEKDFLRANAKDRLCRQTTQPVLFLFATTDDNSIDHDCPFAVQSRLRLILNLLSAKTIDEEKFATAVRRGK